MKHILFLVIVLSIIFGTMYTVNKISNRKILTETKLQEKTKQELMTEQSVSESGEAIPRIDAISPISGPLNTVIDIKGKHVTASLIFESKQTKQSVGLRDSDQDRTVLGPGTDHMKIVLKNPCVKDEVIMNMYMETTKKCDRYDMLTPGEYEVYLATQEWESNRVTFTITAK